MKTIQNIHQAFRQLFSTITIWSDVLCANIMLGFSYNNEPKQAKSWSGYNIS